MEKGESFSRVLSLELSNWGTLSHTPQVHLPPRQKQCLSELWKSLRVRETFVTQQGHIQTLAPRRVKSWRLTPGHNSSLNSAPGKLPCAAAPVWAPLSPHVFQMAKTGPRQENAPGHRGQGNPKGCPTPTNSHEFSAQILINLGRKLVENWPENPQQTHFMSAWPGIQSCSGSNPARKPSVSQVQARPMPPAPQPPGVPSLVLVDAPSPGPESSPGFSVFLLQGPVPRALQLGNPESHATSPPATKPEMVPFRAAENPQRERNLHAPTEVIPKRQCHSRLKS